MSNEDDDDLFHPGDFLDQQYIDLYEKYNVYWQAINKAKIDLIPVYPLWWASWLNYLMLTGHNNQFREQLALTVDKFKNYSRHDIYDEIYKWVLRGTLRWANQPLFKEIWETLPEEVQERENFQKMYERHLMLVEAEKHHSCVFPMTIALEDRWTEKPHLDFPNKEEITSWNPGRVEYIDEADGVIRTVIGKFEFGEMVQGYVDFVREEFESRTLQPKEKDSVLFEIAFDREENYTVKFHKVYMSDEEALFHYPILGID